MSKAAFDKIAEGLTEALAIARGAPAMSEMVERVTWAVCPILLAADECDMPQIINGPRPECRKCPAVESRGGTAGCRVVAELVARAAIAAMVDPALADNSDRPIGRELRLVNAVISLLSLVDRNNIPPGVILSDPILMDLDELRECAALYKRHMLKPGMRRHTTIPVRPLVSPTMSQKQPD